MFFLLLYFLYFLLFCLLLLGSIDFWESPQYFLGLHVLPMSSHASFHKHATSIQNHTTRTTTSPNLLLASKFFDSSILLFKELSCDAFLENWVQTSFEDKNVVNNQASCLLNYKERLCYAGRQRYIKKTILCRQAGQIRIQSNFQLQQYLT